MHPESCLKSDNERTSTCENFFVFFRKLFRKWDRGRNFLKMNKVSAREKLSFIYNSGSFVVMYH